jgi:hypothetical protein
MAATGASSGQRKRWRPTSDLLRSRHIPTGDPLCRSAIRRIRRRKLTVNRPPGSSGAASLADRTVATAREAAYDGAVAVACGRQQIGTGTSLHAPKLTVAERNGRPASSSSPIFVASAAAVNGFLISSLRRGRAGRDGLSRCARNLS